MNKIILSIVTVVGIFGCGGLFAATSELRSQIYLQRGFLHYPLKQLRHEECWHVDLWGAPYFRNAYNAFIKCDQATTSSCGKSSDCSDKKELTTNTGELAKLFFGKECFRGEEAFANGILIGPEASGNPALILNKLCPRFKYTEKGVYLGLHAKRNLCNSNWHVGMRTSLPIKTIDVEQQRSCGSEQIEEQAGNLVVRRQEIAQYIDPNTGDCVTGSDMNNVNAYRLDLLSILNWVDGTPLVKYGNGTNITTIADEPVVAWEDDIPPIPPYTNETAPMYLFSSQDGTISSVLRMQGPYASIPCLGLNLAQSVPADGDLPADGVVNTNGLRYQLRSANNYAAGLALNRDAQGKLFLIPNLTNLSGETLTPESNLVQNAIDYVLNQLQGSGEDSAIAFFKKHNVDFCVADHVTGIGDWYFEGYCGCEGCCREWFLDGILGVVAPTAKKPRNAADRIYYQSPGNSGHLELRGGLELGWRFSDCAALRAFGSYTHVFKRNELRAPFFKGATVFNIPAGDPLNYKVSWNYFWGNIDFTIIYPPCSNCGITIGYEIYAKEKDNVECCVTEAQDFFGFTHTIDCSCAAKRTNTQTHKIRGEMFFNTSCCDFFIGGYYTIAGKYAMKETLLNAGLVIYY